MTRCVALLRGVNVGRAKRLPMAELRALLEDLGFRDVCTLLNSGNAVFDAARPNTGRIAATIETSLCERFGFSAHTIVLTAADLASVIRENGLSSACRDPARLLVAFAASKASLAEARTLLARPWVPEAVAIGRRAAYLWCAQGIHASPLAQAFDRMTGGATTARNWSTVLKLHAVTRAASRPG